MFGKNKKNIERHERRYIALSSFIFGLVAVGHLIRLSKDWIISVESVVIPDYVSGIVIVVMFLMLILGITYLKNE